MTSGDIRVVFFGTPAYAEPALRALVGDGRFDVRLVVTQPDRPAGRGHRLLHTHLKQVAGELTLPVFQPPTLREPATRAHLASFDADVFVVAAYGLIFGTKTLALPRLGCVNLHASILPAYRGAAPIPAAILSGERETGVTLMVMEAGLDTGPIIDIARCPIAPDDTTASLTATLAEIGGVQVTRVLPGWAAGALSAQPQAGAASAVRLLTKADGGIDWARPAMEIERLVRAMWPWPRAWTVLDGTVVQIHRAAVSPERSLRPGAIEIVGNEVLVGTASGAIRLETVQLPGGRPMPGPDAVKTGAIPSATWFTSAPPVESPLIRSV